MEYWGWQVVCLCVCPILPWCADVIGKWLCACEATVHLSPPVFSCSNVLICYSLKYKTPLQQLECILLPHKHNISKYNVFFFLQFVVFIWHCHCGDDTFICYITIYDNLSEMFYTFCLITQTSNDRSFVMRNYARSHFVDAWFPQYNNGHYYDKSSQNEQFLAVSSQSQRIKPKMKARFPTSTKKHVLSDGFDILCAFSFVHTRWVLVHLVRSFSDLLNDYLLWIRSLSLFLNSFLIRQ